MHMEEIAPMVVGVVFILTGGGVILLRPLSRRLGDLLEAMASERRGPALREELTRALELNDSLGERLARLEERQDFTDRLLRGEDRPRREHAPAALGAADRSRELAGTRTIGTNPKELR